MRITLQRQQSAYSESDGLTVNKAMSQQINTDYLSIDLYINEISQISRTRYTRAMNYEKRS